MTGVVLVLVVLVVAGAVVAHEARQLYGTPVPGARSLWLRGRDWWRHRDIETERPPRVDSLALDGRDRVVRKKARNAWHRYAFLAGGASTFGLAALNLALRVKFGALGEIAFVAAVIGGAFAFGALAAWYGRTHGHDGPILTRIDSRDHLDAATSTDSLELDGRPRKPRRTFRERIAAFGAVLFALASFLVLLQQLGVVPRATTTRIVVAGAFVVVVVWDGGNLLRRLGKALG